MHVLLFDDFIYYLMFFSSIKEVNGLISKGMSDIYHWEKLAFSKLVGKENFSERNLEEMH